MEIKKIDISAEIKGLKYTPFMCRKLNAYGFDDLEKALQNDATFILKVDNNQMGVSWWVSPKRTRSYPYARVYDSLACDKRVTIIPIMKDEGKDGDRDFLQWDTISLMSLLNVNVIISYYVDASKSLNYKNKITNQKFDVGHVEREIRRLLNFQSDALHWNLSQIENAGSIAENALKFYKEISNKLGVTMHSEKSAKRRVDQLLKGKETFMNLSRELAEKAQKREAITIQPKEHLTGIKATLTIKNYLGGYYYFTCDEVEIHEGEVYLIEGKHAKNAALPSLDDIKDGLLKMILFTNLQNVKINEKHYNPVPILKLTTGAVFQERSLNNKKKQILEFLKKEAKANGFRVVMNNKFIA